MAQEKPGKVSLKGRRGWLSEGKVYQKILKIVDQCNHKTAVS